MAWGFIIGEMPTRIPGAGLSTRTMSRITSRGVEKSPPFLPADP